MKINFDVAKLISRGRPFTIQFKDVNITATSNSTGSPCMLQYNGTEDMTNKTLILEADFNECGIEVYQREDQIVFNQTILVTFVTSNLVKRLEQIAFEMECIKVNNFTVDFEGNQKYLNVNGLTKEVFSLGKLFLILIEFLLQIIVYSSH